MQVFSKIEKWAKNQWQKSDLGDKRRNKRAVKLATSLIQNPELSLPRQLEDWSELKAAYRLLNSPDISHEKLQNKHWSNVRKAAQKSDSSVVLFIQDTSQLDYTSQKATQGLGPIGDHKGRGIVIHSTLAVAYDKEAPQILGLANQQAWIRKDISYRKTETRYQRFKRISEANIWENSLRNIKKPNKTNNTWISVGDRGNDMFIFIRFCKNNAWNYLMRARADRTIFTQTNHSLKLFDWVKTLHVQTEKVINLRSRNGIPARTVTLKVAWSQVQIFTPKNGFKKSEQEFIDIWCIRCWEDTPNGLEWILLTNMPILNAEDALEKISYYEARWIIEEYHKCLKTGCSIEKRQLQSAQGLLALLGILGVIATKLLEIKFLARQHATELAQNYIPLLSLKFICSRYKLNIKTITMRQFWHKVAGLGGFLGRKSDGEPGWQSLWYGWLSLLNMINTAEFLQRCG